MLLHGFASQLNMCCDKRFSANIVLFYHLYEKCGTISKADIEIRKIYLHDQMAHVR